MGISSRLVSLSLVLLLAAPGLWAQSLAPALATRFSEGVQALKAGQLDLAEAAFRDVLARGGDRAFVHHNLGIVHQQRNHHVEALAEFRAAARLDPALGPARLLAGSSLLALGRAEEAVAELERAVRLLPGEKAAHLQLADACERVDNVPCLARESRVLAAYAPSDPEYTYRLGKAYLRLSEWSYTRILAIDPRSSRLSEALGREYLQQGQPELALREYQQAAERDPALPGIHLALARIHADALRWDDATREVERELAVAPGSAAALELKARVDAARTVR
ncbi:MAG: tetratricopeptide repeat protein [Vicinamibacteria bacterium]|nr:tetratricopeptide repeat protein [Vicinamibacteria bacterium]